MSDASRLAQELADAERRLRALERKGQLTGSTVHESAILAYDLHGNLRQIIGRQPDDRYTITDHGGPPPPVPAAPGCEILVGGAAVTWDGKFADAILADESWGPAERPADVEYVEVHAATVPVYTPTNATQVGTIESKRGGRIVVGLGADVEWYVTLVAVSSSYVESAPSAPTTVVPLPALYTRFYQDTLAVTGLAAEHHIPLTYEPVGGSEHVYWNRVYQPGDRWHRSGGAIVVPDDDRNVQPGDLLTVEYAHAGQGAAPLPEPAPAPAPTPGPFDGYTLAVEIGMAGPYEIHSGLTGVTTSHPEWASDLLMDYSAATYAAVNGYIGPSGVFLSHVQGGCALVRGGDPIPADAGYRFYFRLRYSGPQPATAHLRDYYGQTASVDLAGEVIYEGDYLYLPMTEGGEADARARVNAFVTDPLGYGASYTMRVAAAADRFTDPYDVNVSEAWVVAFAPGGVA